MCGLNWFRTGLLELIGAVAAVLGDFDASMATVALPIKLPVGISVAAFLS